MPQERLEQIYLKEECSGGGCDFGGYHDPEEIKKKTNLTDAQLRAILKYTLEEFQNINPGLASGSLTNPQAAFVRIMDCALEKIPSQKVTVYRGASRRIPMAPGKVVVFEPYTSTSLDREQAKTFIRPNGRLMILKVRSAKDISQISNAPTEKELLLPRGLKFKVESVKQEKMKLDDPEDPRVTRKELIEVVTLSEI